MPDATKTESTTRGPGPRAAALGLSYRPITPADIGFLCALYHSTREAELARVPWSEAEKQSFITQQFEAQHSHYQTHYPEAEWLVIERAGRPVGRLYIERWAAEDRIIDIALIPAARGAGLGRAILSDVVADAASTGRCVGIHVEKTNPAMTLYRRLGFRVVEDKGVYDLLIWEGAEGQV